MEIATPQVRHLVLFFFTVVGTAALGVAYPLLYRHIVNVGILQQNTTVIIDTTVAVSGLAVFEAILSVLQTYLATEIGSAIVVDLRAKLYAKIQRMPLAFFANTRTGALINRLVGDATAAKSAFTDVLSNVVGNSISIILVVSALFILSWRITIAALLLFPLFVVITRSLNRRVRLASIEIQRSGAAMTSLMIERFNVAGALLGKLYGNPQEDVRNFRLKAHSLAQASVKSAIYGRTFATALLLVATLATAMAYGWGGVLVSRNIVDIGTVVAIVALLGRLAIPLTSLSNAQLNIVTALVAFERIFEVLDHQPSIRERDNACELPVGPLSVVFANVEFKYPAMSEVLIPSLDETYALEVRPQGEVLSDISFRAAPGQLVAVVGRSGSGKTSLVNLVSRLYDVTSGSVLLSDVDVRQISLNCLRARIGVVSQDAHFFHETLRANLSCAKPGVSDSEMRNALRDAQILDEVERLPEGLDTMMGESGHRFSGGEKQRLAIARLLIKAPDIVILDEATAHMDSHSESRVQAALDIALKGRTSIVIAHRLSTVRKANTILVLDHGNVVERGRHEELLALRGAYWRLFQQQKMAAS